MRTLLGFLAALLLLAGIGAAVAPATAGVQDFEFESFHADYALGLDDSGHAFMHVTETIVARFPDFDQNRGIIRAIPSQYRQASLELRMLSVTDEHGDPVRFERDEAGGFAEFALGTDEFVHGRTTYVLEYTLKHVIAHFADAQVDEFYWDVNGTGWSQPFDRVSASIQLSPELAAARTGAIACYQGYQGSADTCDLTVDGDRFTAAVGPLAPYQNVTVVIAFEPGTVVQPPLAKDHWIVSVLPLVLLALAGLVMGAGLLLRLTRWRDATVPRALIAQYGRPEGTWLLLDADIAGNPKAGVPAQLVDLAVRGHLRIIDASASGGRRFILELVTVEGLTDEELRVVRALFGDMLKPGKRVDPGMLSASRGDALYRLSTSIRAKTVVKNLRARPADSSVAGMLRWAAFVLAIAGLPVWWWASEHDVLTPVVVWCPIGTAAAAIATAAILRKPTLLTEAGAELKHHLLGIREYLTIAEEERIRMLQGPETAERRTADGADPVVRLYESLLPWAIVWGVEDQWVQHLQAIAPQRTPDWFQGSSFSAATLANFEQASVSRMAPRPVASSGGGSSWSSSGSSSFSSGSSGGGFSGGGGGGGGGGGR